MGAEQSTAMPPPPPNPLTDTPWKKFKGDIWTDQYLRKTLTGLEERFHGNDHVQFANAVLLGPIGSGKSSYVNSVMSIGHHTIPIRSSAPSGDSDKSYTTQLGVYIHKDQCATISDIRLYDTMGLEVEEGEGFNVDDISMLLKGHVPKNYKFNPRSPISSTDKGFIKKPKHADKTHCVVFCIKAETAINCDKFPMEMRRKIARLQDEINALGIPRIVLVTHVDEACKVVDEDITKLFYSKAIEKAVQGASDVFKLPESYIYPIENYHKSSETNRDTNIPLILSLCHILDLANDYFTRNDPDKDCKQ